MYRLIVSDYDGTLNINEKPLSNQFFIKLNNLSNRGSIFALASGRPYNQLKKLFFKVSNSIVFVADDGAQVMYKNCLLYKKTVEMNDAKAICKLALNSGFVAICALREENRSVKQEQLSLPFFLSADIFKVIIIKDGKNAEAIKDFAKSLNVRVCYEDDTYLEFCHKDANKGEAVKKIMQKFGVSEAQTIIFGDGINDIPMLKLTKNRFFPENADKTVLDLGGTVIKSVEDFILDI